MTTETPKGSEGLVEKLEELRLFLSGEGELDGVSFGERPGYASGNFWWRRHLPALSHAAQRIEELEGAMRKIARLTIANQHETTRLLDIRDSAVGALNPQEPGNER